MIIPIVDVLTVFADMSLPIHIILIDVAWPFLVEILFSSLVPGAMQSIIFS